MLVLGIMGWLATKDEKFRFQHRLNWPFGNFYKKFFDLFWCQWTLWTVSLETESRGVKKLHVFLRYFYKRFE